jgi:hypothetical protein
MDGTDRWTERTDGQNGQMDGTDRQADGRIDGRTDEWTHGRMDGRTERQKEG